MRDDYLQAALKIIDDPNILVNVVSRRVKQLKRGNRALVESLEKLLRKTPRCARSSKARSATNWPRPRKSPPAADRGAAQGRHGSIPDS